MPYESEKTPGENLKLLSQRLEEKKALRQSSFHQLYLGVEAMDPETFTPMQTQNSKDSFARCVIAPPEEWEFPTEFEQIADSHNFIAVVHIDGNAMVLDVSQYRLKSVCLICTKQKIVRLG